MLKKDARELFGFLTPLCVRELLKAFFFKFLLYTSPSPSFPYIGLDVLSDITWKFYFVLYFLNFLPILADTPEFDTVFAFTVFFNTFTFFYIKVFKLPERLTRLTRSIFPAFNLLQNYQTIKELFKLSSAVYTEEVFLRNEVIGRQGNA